MIPLLISLTAHAAPLTAWRSGAGTSLYGIHDLTVARDTFDGWQTLASGPQLGGGGAVVALPLDGAPGFWAAPQTLIHSTSDGFGRAIGVADFDGDGLQDLVVTRASPYGGDGRIYLFRGGAHTWPAVEAEADLTIDGDVPDGGLGMVMAVLPDMTGDGLPDLAVQQPRRAQRAAGAGYLADLASVWLLSPASLSGTTRIDRVPGAIRYDGGPDERLGLSLTWSDDADGDGLRELVTAEISPGPTMHAAVQLSSRRRPVQDGRSGAARLVGAATTTGIDGELATADLDGDGRNELILGAPGRDPFGAIGVEGALYIVPGGLALRVGDVFSLAGNAPTLWIPDHSYLGAQLKPVRDLDGDGADELAAVAVDAVTGGLTTLLIPGRAVPLRPGLHVPQAVRLSSTAALRHSGAIAAGDADGDGDGDLVLTAHGSGFDTEFAAVRFGR
jgi:hypothetical protein